MNTNIDFSLITVPQPEPYDDKNEHKQRENVCFVFLQIVDQLKQNGATLDLGAVASQTVSIDLTELVQAVKDLTFTGERVEVGNFTLEHVGKVITLSAV